MKTNYRIKDDTALFYLELLSINDHQNNPFEQLKREKHIKFHIEIGDYISNLATIVDLLSQSNIVTPRKRREVLESIRDDLVFINKNYRITKK